MKLNIAIDINVILLSIEGKTLANGTNGLKVRTLMQEKGFLFWAGAKCPGVDSTKH